MAASNLIRRLGRSERVAATALASAGTIVGSSFGMVLPFVVTAWFKGVSQTDPYFFAAGTTLFVTSLLSVVLESTMPSYVFEHKRRGREELERWVRGMVVQSGALAAILAIAVISIVRQLLLSRTSFGDEQIALASRCLLILAGLPVLVTISSVMSSVHYAFGKFGLATVSQAIRPGMGLALGFLWRESIGIEGIAYGLLIGEGIRLGLLSVQAIRLMSTVPVTLDDGTAFGESRRFWRTAAPSVLSMLIVGLSPLTDKFVSAGLGIGSVTIIELTEKLFYTPLTLLTSGLALVTATRWADLAQDQARLGELRRDYWLIQRLIWVGGVIISAGIVGASWVLRGSMAAVLGIPDAHALAMTFTLFAVGLPTALSASIGARLMAACRSTTLLPAFALFAVVSNLLLDLVLARRFGVAGIALASSIVRALSASLYLGVARGLLSGRARPRSGGKACPAVQY